MGYIDKDKVIEEITRLANRSMVGEIDEPYLDWKTVVSVIFDAQTADVQEVRYCKFELVQDGKGVCSNCHRLDSIDKLAKCCRYCGAFLKWEDDSNG